MVSGYEILGQVPQFLGGIGIERVRGDTRRALAGRVALGFVAVLEVPAADPFELRSAYAFADEPPPTRPVVLEVIA